MSAAVSAGAAAKSLPSSGPFVNQVYTCRCPPRFLNAVHNVTGLLSHAVEGTALAIRQLLANPDYARWLGQNGREHVRHNFLITCHIKDYLLLFLAPEQGGGGLML